MTTAQMTEQLSRKAGARIAFMFVAFFLVVAGVNAVFITLATGSHSGVVEENAYARGLAYNEVLQAAKDQASLGWHVVLVEGGDGSLVMTALDRSGQAMMGADVTGVAKWPVKAGADHAFRFMDMNAGRYVATPDWPFAGQWNLEVDITWQDQSYRWQGRITVDPKALN